MYDVFKEGSVYRNRFDKVWMWKDWADENNLHEELGTSHDLGVDIVARERASGELCAIQCKCNADDTYLSTTPVSKFISYGTAHNMKNYILACTGPINSNACAKLKGVKCGIIKKEHLRCMLDWSTYPKTPKPPEPKKLRDYQKKAFDDVVSKFDIKSRGKMIMACGTGKTLVSLHIAEKLAKKGGLVLYLVPSISLILQSMREWADNANMKHYYMAVCSDKSVRNTEQGTLTELEAPASTDPKDLEEKISNIQNDSLNVIFSTYHSIDVVSKAMGDKQFDIVFCDEAHRTAGIEKDAGESYYVKVHHERNIKARKRLYMTATPKIYSENVKEKGEEQQRIVTSMNDESIYGGIFHNLTFYDAVHKYDALCDFKVRVAVMDADTMDKLVQRVQAGDENQVPINEKTLMASVWHAIQYPGVDEKKTLLQRVIFFADMINSSKIIAGEKIKYNVDYKEDLEKLENAKNVDAQRSFKQLVHHINDVFEDKNENTVDVRHVDGADNAEFRRDRLEWLKNSDDDPNTCRVLSNARCLSEGVDVPALDGVVFLNPRKSVVDVVQAVGRVMRKSEGKEYGYVILPVVVPMGMSVDEALSDNKTFKVVWQVLNALRSHDSNLENEINRLTLGPIRPGSNEVTNRIIIRHAYSHDLGTADMPEGHMIQAISTKLVKKVGDVGYYDKYGKELGQAAHTVREKIKNRKEEPRVKKEVKQLWGGLKSLINDSVTEDETIGVIAQHMVLSRIFDKLFQGEFVSHNPISKTLAAVVKKLQFDEELKTLEGFYKEAETELERITTREARQNFIKKLYDNFFQGYAKKETEKFGIVYTPVEIIDFILNSVQHVLKMEFESGFDDRSVKVLDPFTGMGTFLSRLMELELLGDSIYEKYKHDLHANEIMLLAYYVATVNIETTYSSLRQGNKYVPFDGISYTDSLLSNPLWRLGEHHRQMQGKLDDTFKEAHKRLQNQRGSHLHVIVGNPPYSAGRETFKDMNQNLKYPIDNRIENTYLKKLKEINPKFGNVNSIYDSYIRSIRWASDRIGNSGVIGFVTNASFILSPTTAGMRACLKEEFTDVWVFDLLGKKGLEGHGRNVFEYPGVSSGGTTTQIAIIILVKNPDKKKHTIHYRALTKTDYSGPDKRLEVKKLGSIQNIKNWRKIEPDKHADWLDKKNPEFVNYLPMGSKDAKAGKGCALFRAYSLGVATHRDVWVYNSSEKELEKNIKLHIDYCNSQDPDDPKIDPKRGKWTSELTKALKKYGIQKFDKNKIRVALYRPFFKQNMYFDAVLNSAQYRIPKFFPKPDSNNLVICVPYKGADENFSTLVTDKTPDLHIIAQNQCFPFKTKNEDLRERERERVRTQSVHNSTLQDTGRIFGVHNGHNTGSRSGSPRPSVPDECDGEMIDNITDFALNEYREHYNDKKIIKMDIFYYIYGILHHNGYKKKYANNLTRELPHIPMAPDFWQFSKIGKKLADLHLSWETCKRHKLGKPKNKFGKYEKMAFAKKKDIKTGRQVDDKTTLKINGIIIFDNLPETNYRVNGRTPLDWAIDRYKRTVDKDSGIVNDATDMDVIPLIERLVYVGMESDRLVSQLPKEFEPKNWKPKKTGIDYFTETST